MKVLAAMDLPNSLAADSRSLAERGSATCKRVEMKETSTANVFGLVKAKKAWEISVEAGTNVHNRCGSQHPTPSLFLRFCHYRSVSSSPCFTC
jgi:hypothetical protein